MTSRSAWLVVLLGACSGVAPAPEPAPERASASASAECQSPPAALASYDAITDGVPFSLQVRRDERGAWLPSSPLAMPMHHASMITWTDAQHLLDAQPPGAPVIVFATGLGRTAIEHDEERGVWFATYGARVDRVCPVE